MSSKTLFQLPVNLPRTPADINGMLSVVFVGAASGKLSPESLGNMFRVRKQKVWNFLLLLKHLNRLYSKLTYDSNIMDLYPEDGILPEIENRIIEDEESCPEKFFSEETAGFSDHYAALFRSEQLGLLTLNTKNKCSNSSIYLHVPYFVSIWDLKTKQRLTESGTWCIAPLAIT